METASDFVALDVGNIAIATGGDKDSSSTSSPRVIKSLFRKGSLRVGGDNDKAAAAAAIDGDAATAFALNGTGGEKHAVAVHVARTEEAVTVSHVLTASSAVGTKYRRNGSSRRSASPWIDPRSVLFGFATLSSMGTLIILYFTFSMSKMAVGDADAR